MSESPDQKPAITPSSAAPANPTAVVGPMPNVAPPQQPVASPPAWGTPGVWTAHNQQALTMPPTAYPVGVLHKKPYDVDMRDSVLSFVVLAFGFLAWNWIWPRLDNQSGVPVGLAPSIHFPALGVTAFFALAVACSLIYFRLRKVRLGKAGIMGAVLILLAALPFAIYTTTPIHFFAGMALLVGYITWHGYAAGTAISSGLDGLTTADVLNQCFVVPFSNAGSWFASLRQLVHRRRKGTSFVFAIIGVLVALPVIAGVLALLMHSDSRFDTWMNRFGQAFTGVNVWHFVWQFCLGIPLAIYMFASLHGNAHRRNTDTITRRLVSTWGVAMRKIPVAAVATPITILCVMYVVFFAAMGSYLVSALQHTLPPDFTYAEYARQGFFELSVVVGINLAVILIVWLFARRGADGLSISLRVLGEVLSGLTLLLIITAASKMVLYVDQFGLTRLRVYTLWFMAVMLIVFGLLGAWHIKAFKVGRPIAIVAIVAFLALLWANTDAIIADYDVNRYLSGASKTIDTNYLENIGQAATPALINLMDNAPDPTVRQDATDAVQNLATAGTLHGTPWTSWTWQTWQADRQLGR
ncbi:MAG: DUF4173 domain-containing protein [Propionibacteriaceae bacterium]|nr:DUF4173 domain-containing protein [Propionibacteriaceae bacterium]